ncbi:sugar phosphate isomerase/epimerase and 4-hydroxyphenylpyruvate domain-containing protein [Tropicibacter sp. R15_0]|uniref:bifunctional sugar phosphate isomerase/epimerase/4-hydroxyphenylpyruvate dioxygenase family protein n=1 Tax=Tropicibacter sp. R15_0 TaxID=2821101 RepID=UPI001ADAA184|nr:sugar phosphate isomerase/epimerase and 4-hydroxyphenylpyruvate domain-containing protein [Tropicibacter sp. R15_0]MBO9468415.1 sugar phosphate isomerase/epimerase and 4-hydroxyphenylpyruvate domain-containing protein [Tropicibacter sp. R15_0]
MSLAISTTSIPGDLEEKLSVIADAGFGAVELHQPDFTGFHGSAEDVAQMAQGLGLSINLLKPFNDLEGWEGAERTRAFDRLERKFDLMGALGTEMLLIGASSRKVSTEQTATDLADAADRAKARGMRLAYLALPWAGLVQTDTQALDLIQQIDSPNLGLALNSYFSLADGVKPAQLRDMPGARVFHVQLSDAPRTPGTIRSLKRHFGMLPGLGSLNLAGFVKVLSRAGYKGAWSVARVNEHSPSPGGRTLAQDGYRALVNLLDEVSRSDPDLHFDIPDLPPRVYTSGFEFIEFAADATSGKELTDMLSAMCFRMERKHVSKSVELWRQGAINIVVNAEEEGFAHSAFIGHGPSVCDMGLRVKDADQTVARATALGTPQFSQPVGTGELDIPAIRGVGGNVVHFIDEKSDLHRVWDIEFEPVAKTEATQPAGLRRVDHVAQTMRYEEMQSWLLYYTSTFEMAKSVIVDVADPAGVVHSQAIESPEGEVRLNLNGAEGHRTFAASFLADRFGAGVQHIAFLSDDIFETSAQLAAQGFARLEISPNYYDDLQAQFGLDDDLVARLRAGNILFDQQGNTAYYQIYSQPIFQGFFFEIVQRSRSYTGYGARNASARLAAQMKHQRPAGIPRT